MSDLARSATAATADQSRRRRRELAGDERAGRFARYRYRQAYRAYIRRQWKVLSAGAALFLSVTAIAALLIRDPLARGITIGFGVTATAAALAHLVVLASGAAPLMMGELAEQWTAGELRRLQRAGWRVVNHFGLVAGDIDHIVVGSSGIFVIETKWSASAWTENWAREDVEAAHAQAERGAKRMMMWENYKQLNLPAPRPIVALWGVGSENLARALDRADVVAGSDLVAKLESKAASAPRLTDDQLDGVWHVLSEHLRKRDLREARNSPMPDSLQTLAIHLVFGVLTGLMSFLAAACLLKTGLPLWSWFVLVIAAAVAAHPLRRWTQTRPVVAGAQAGFVLTALLAAAIAGAQILR